ncbi:MAG: winged helix-turn-helix transcriptional regulator [Anaerolineales bacterium]|nr:winged helix-turn-helix transcriptional regulator [Chloroflexota bacterium]MBL6981289.1 winged helix-turn-helix transcriptional regulator [Anaerolineales bacterium]
MKNPTLSWDFGTGYDFFVCLYVLHEPDEFGLRPSWAAGVRSRLPVEDREILEQVQTVVHFPFSWVYALQGTKDSAAVIWALRQMDPEERIPALAKSSGMPNEVLNLLEGVANRGNWDPKELDSLREQFKANKLPALTKKAESILDLWLDLSTFGERYFAALQTYRDVFFAEEEERIQPALQVALQIAQQWAKELTFEMMIERVSRGVRFEEGLDVAELVMVPSYWITPLVVNKELAEGNKQLFLFGARPEDDSLVPGAQVPDGMLRTLKTLADPTRLRILRYLSQETMSPAQLARRLRLRAPTVTHHLSALRLAGLVYLTLGEKKGKLYTTRFEAISGTFSTLEEFLSENSEDR